MLDFDLTDMLKINQNIKTQVSKDLNWLNNKVISIEKDVVQLGFKNEYLKLLLTVGDTFKIKFLHHKKECVLVGYVENIFLGNPHKLYVRIENIVYYENTRKYARCDINLFCKIEPSKEDFKIQGITTNISEGGISVVTYADFNIVEPVNVEIITNKNDIIHFIGKIRRLDSKLNNHIQYGVEILEISEDNRELMNKLIAISSK